MPSNQLTQLHCPRPKIRDKLISRFTISYQNLVPLLRVSTHISQPGRTLCKLWTLARHFTPSANRDPTPNLGPPIISCFHQSYCPAFTTWKETLFELLNEGYDPMQAGYVAWSRGARYIVFHDLLWRSNVIASEVLIPAFSRGEIWAV